MADLEMRATRLRLFSFLIISLVFIQSTNANEYGIDYRLNVMGAYLVASDLNSKLNSSACGQYIKKKNPVNLEIAIQKIEAELKPSEVSEFKIFIASKKFRHDLVENQQFIDVFTSRLKNEGVDDKFGCGLLVGTIITTSAKAFNEFKKLTER